MPVGGLLAVVAGAAIVAGSMLEWMELSTPAVAFEGGRVSGSSQGIDSTFGIVAIIAGAVVIVGALLWIARRSAGQIPGILVSLAGLAAAAVGLYVLLTLKSRFIDVAVSEAASPELPAAKIEDLLSRLFAAGSIDIKPGMGLIALLAGSALAVLVGIAGLIRRRAPAAAAKGW